MIEIGPKKENEVSCWTVAVGNLQGPFGTRKVRRAEKALLEYFKTLDGFVGITPCYPRGILLLFRSEYDAVSGRNLIRARGVQVGDNITEVYVDKAYLPEK